MHSERKANHAQHNTIKAIAIFVTVALLLNVMAPKLAHAATYLQGTEVNANTLVQDAYVAVTYYDSNGEQKLEKGWIDAVGETSFTIRSGALFGKKTIAYENVLSVIMSDESTESAKQMNEVNRFIRNVKAREIERAKKESKAEDHVIQWLSPINAKAPTPAHAATYLEGVEVNANTLIRDAYVAVTYYDSKDKQKLEKGWIDEVGEISFTIRSGGIKDKKTITYNKVVSVIMSDKSNTLKQMNEVNRFIGEQKKEEELKDITIMSGEQIDFLKIRKGWYAHVIYTSEGEEETVTGRITRQDSVHIVIRVQEESVLRVLKTIAYRDIDTLVISQYTQSIEAYTQSIEAWKKAKHQVQRYLENGYYTKCQVRVQAPSIWKGQVVGTLIKMTPDTLVVQRGGTFFELPVSSISNFEVNIRQRNTGKGFKIGLGAGAIIIGYTSIYTSKEIKQINPRGTDPQSQHFSVALLRLLGYSAGAIVCLLSTLIGGSIKSDKWVEVPPHSLNLSLVPTSTKGLCAALTFNF